MTNKTKTSTNSLISEELVPQLADLFSMMGDTSRLRIILRLLKAARMVRAERRGKQVFYVAADQHVQCVIEDMAAHVSEPHSVEDE